MPETKVQAPGTFCWCDLSTPDVEAAKTFYAGLFGWTMEDNDAGDAGIYTMLRSAGMDVGGLAGQSDEMKAQGVPPHWMSYIMVEDADAVAAKAKEHGGTVMMEAFDVMDVGRMAIISDPAGAVFALWQAKSHRGASAMGQPNSPCWFECLSQNKAEAQAFYAAVFGWELQSFPGAMDYTLFKQGEVSTGGIMQITPEMGDVPSNWMIYFAVDDCDESVKKAEGLGAKILNPPTDIPEVGRFALLCDPTGAAFSIIKLG